MSLKFRQLSKIKDAGRSVTLRVNDGDTIEGTIVDLDQNDVCIRDGEFERTLSLNAIVDIQARASHQNSTYHQLQHAMNNGEKLTLYLQNKEIISDVEVIDLETTEVLVRNHSQERVITIEQVTQIVSGSNPSSNLVGPSPSATAPRPPSSSSYSVSESISPISYPNVRQAAAILEQQLNALSWPIHEFPQLIRKCPVPPRTHPKPGKIWSRALNYENDRSWQKAAQEFEKFIALKLDSFEACHNAGVCWFEMSDFRMAIIYFDYGIEREQDPQILRAGIIAANRAGYWHKSLDWMLRYLNITKGADMRAFMSLDFGLKFGLYKTTIKNLKAAAEAKFPIDYSWSANRLAYVAIRYPTLSGAVLTELEQILTFRQTTIENIIQIAEVVSNIAIDTPSLEYRNSQQSEKAFLQQYPSLDFKRIDYLRNQAEELRKNYKFREAKKFVEELLEMVPSDEEGLRILRDLEIRLAPPKFVPKKNISKPKSGNQTFNAAKKAEQRGDLEQAVKLYKQCIANKESKWQSAVMDLAGICLRREDIEVGVNYILQYQSELDPISSNNMLGALYFKAGKYDEAIHAYRLVEQQKTSPQEKVNPMISIAMIRVRQGDIQNAKGILQKALRIQPDQPAAKGLMQSIQTGVIQTQIGNFEIDREGHLNLRRVVGVGTIGIGDFLEAELELTEITGLNREIIVNQRFTLKDVNYLLGKAGDFGKGKPEQVAQHCISAAKVLDILNERSDDRFSESLRRFCAAQADYYAIKNFDVARTYYVQSFQLEDTITTQLRFKFIQLLMTFLCDSEEFLKPQLAHDAQTLLEHGFSHPDANVRRGLALSVLNVARKNPDILVKSQEYFRQSKIRHGMVRVLAELLNEHASNSDNQTLEKLVELGQQFLEKSEGELEERFKYFLDNSNSHQLLYDLYSRFIDWQPKFKDAGVDFGGTDVKRIEEMKNILRQYIRFRDENVFEEKDNLRNAVITQIQRLQQDIKQFPTHYSRCYMLPILHKWIKVVEIYFDEIASVSKPNLEISEVAKATYNNKVVSIHLVVSNSQGKSAASGIRINLLPSTSGDYELSTEHFELGKTLRAGEELTAVAEVNVHQLIPAFTLNYQISYTDRQGNVLHTPDSNIAVRLVQEKFEPIHNPYARWASSNEVSDPEMFFGRDQLVSELIELFCVPGQRKMVVIHGQKRAGKSSILYHVKRRIDEEAEATDVVVCAFKMSIGDVILDFNLAKFFYVLARELHKNVKEKLSDFDISFEFQTPKREDFREDPFNQFLEFTEELTESFQDSIATPINLLMIIDEFTYIYEMIQKGNLDYNFMKAWKALVERHLFSFLLSGIDEMPEFVNAYPNEFAVADLKRVSYLDSQWSKNLIEKPIWNKSNNTSRFQESAVSRIQELTGNSAYYIQIFNNQLVEYMNREKTGYITEADIASVTRQLTYGRDALNLASNFDNLTRFRNNELDSPEVEVEGKLLRLIAFLTKNEGFAHHDSILRRFPINSHDIVESLIYRLIGREVLEARAGSQQYAFVVDIFKEWLNMNLPYEEELQNE